LDELLKVIEPSVVVVFEVEDEIGGEELVAGLEGEAVDRGAFEEDWISLRGDEGKVLALAEPVYLGLEDPGGGPLGGKLDPGLEAVGLELCGEGTEEGVGGVVCEGGAGIFFNNCFNVDLECPSPSNGWLSFGIDGISLFGGKSSEIFDFGEEDNLEVL